MKYILTLSVIAFCLTGNSFAQQALKSENGEILLAIDNFNEYAQTYQDVDGSPFLFKEWQSAVFKFESGEDVKIELCNIDTYQNKLLFQNNEKSYYITNLNDLKKFTIGNKDFYNLNKGKEFVFFEILVENEDLVLLKKYNCEILSGKKSDGINPKKNDRFKIISTIYTSKGGTSLEVLKLKEKYVLEFMNDKKQEMKEFIASNKLKCKDETDLIKIFDHYLTLL